MGRVEINPDDEDKGVSSHPNCSGNHHNVLSMWWSERREKEVEQLKHYVER